MIKSSINKQIRSSDFFLRIEIKDQICIHDFKTKNAV